jgi:hypothetical protein
VLVPCFMSRNKIFQKLCTNLWAFLFCQDNLSTWQVWHIKKPINSTIITQVHLVLETIKGHLQCHLREFDSTSNRLHTRPCQPRTTNTHNGFFTCGIIWDQPPRQLMILWICTSKQFLQKLPKIVNGKLICVLVVLTRVLTWLQFGVVTDFSGQMLTFDGHWHAGEV